MKENYPDSVRKPSLTTTDKELDDGPDTLTNYRVKQLSVGKAAVPSYVLTTCDPRLPGAFLGEKPALVKPIINGRLQFKANKVERINQARINHDLQIVIPYHYSDVIATV
jgi:hypothetical protein